MSEREPSFLGGEPGGAPLGPPRVGSFVGDPRVSRPPLGTRPSREPAGPTFHAAGFWRRAGAAAIDLAILAPVCLLLTWLAGQITGIHLPTARFRSVDFWLDLLFASDPALIGAAGLTVAIGLVYALIFQLAIGRTPGMRAVGVRVIDLYGDDPSVARALARTAGYLAGLASLGLGFLWIAFDREKRGLHDYLAGTFVVKT